VNFSRVHMMDNNFATHLREILEHYRVEPRYIQVELTETAFFENRESTLQMIKQLHAAGFTIAMDDFGTGYSSLNFLKNIPIDVLKIDKLFFESFATDHQGTFAPDGYYLHRQTSAAAGGGGRGGVQGRGGLFADPGLRPGAGLLFLPSADGSGIV
jgi:EAL domain-containing protein (putative c-di-GMP-specific phosphodiesterase class I)